MACQDGAPTAQPQGMRSYLRHRGLCFFLCPLAAFVHIAWLLYVDCSSVPTWTVAVEAGRGRCGKRVTVVCWQYVWHTGAACCSLSEYVWGGQSACSCSMSTKRNLMKPNIWLFLFNFWCSCWLPCVL